MSWRRGFYSNVEEKSAALVKYELGFFKNEVGHQKNCEEAVLTPLEILEIWIFADGGRNWKFGEIG